MTTIRHKKIGYNQGHAPHSYEYTNRAHRLSQVPANFQSWEIDRVALQKDNNSYQRLSQITPTVKWTPLVGSVMFQILQADQVSNITYDAEGLITRTDYSSGYYCTIQYTAFGKAEFVNYHVSNGDIVERWQYHYNVNEQLTSTTQVI